MLAVREFRNEDIDECTALFLKVFTAEPWNDRWESFDYAREYLTEFVVNPMFQGFVACDDGHIVGVCFGHTRSFWQGREYEIDEMYVDTDVQGKGIGTQLIGHVKDALKKQGIIQFFLITGKGFPAEKFYAKNGFYRNDSIILMNGKIE